MNKKLKKQLNTAFYAPEPVKKDSFLKKLRPREITTTEMIFQQLPYIRKTVWLMAVAVLTVAVIGSYVASENTVRVIEALAPLAAVSACLEMQRSYRYQMPNITGFITSWGPLMIVLLVALTVYENYKTVNTMEEFA